MNAKDVPEGFPAELTIEQITWAFDVSPRRIEHRPQGPTPAA
jgi:hypothetical protein